MASIRQILAWVCVLVMGTTTTMMVHSFSWTSSLYPATKSRFVAAAGTSAPYIIVAMKAAAVNPDDLQDQARKLREEIDSFEKERYKIFETNDLDKYLICIENFNNNFKLIEHNILKEIYLDLGLSLTEGTNESEAIDLQ